VTELVGAAEVRRRRQRVRELVDELPATSVTGDQHLSLYVRKKRFGYLLEDHHGDGRLSLACRAASGVNRLLVSRDPATYHLPAYVGAKGWAGMWLDRPTIDWDAVNGLLVDAYCITAPKSLVAQVRGDAAGGT
jgi:hypothetical protein